MENKRLSVAGVLLNIVLFGIKLWAGVLSGSVAILSDALNSLLDIVSYTGIYIAVRVQELGPDQNHPFGHRRAESLAGLVIAVVAAMLGATILNDSVSSFLNPGSLQVLPVFVVVVVISMVSKAILAFFYWRAGRKTDSAALTAGAVDSRNDVLASGVALTGFVLGPAADAGAAAVVGLWIIYSGVQIGLDNLGPLMGEAPPVETMQRLRKEALKVDGVTGVNTFKGHMVGDRIHLEIHIEVDKRLSLEKAHAIDTAVSQRLEMIERVNRAFIHVDPVSVESRGTDAEPQNAPNQLVE